MPIQTNKVVTSIDYSKLDEQYDFFVITTTEKYIKRGAQILDVPSSYVRIQSIFFIGGKRFYVMMQKNIENKIQLKKILISCDEGKHLTISQLRSNELESVSLLQLLLNGLCNSKNHLLCFNNLTGHLYCFHPSWLKHKRTETQDEIVKVPCLEIRFTGDNLLTLDVKTFSSTKLKNKITFRKRKIEEYPKYCFATKNTLKRATEEDSPPLFILRQTDGAKTEIPFLDIQDIDKFLQSKMGVLSTVVDQFNDKYADIASIRFTCIENYNRIDHKRKNDRINHSAIASRLKNRTIRIVDKIGDSYSSMFCNELSKLFENKYGVCPSFGTRLSKTGLNVILIHNASYYIDMDDPHDIVKPEYAIQHITLEDFAGCAEYAVSTVVNELMIKDDLRSGKISLFDWRSLCLTDDVFFGTEAIVNESEKFIFMKVHSDGSFEIVEREFDLFTADEYLKYVKIYEDAKTASEKVRGIICDGHGNINVIKDTDWFTIPKVGAIKAELSNGNNKLRGKEARKRLLDAVLDIKWFEKDNSIYYFANDIGEGMRWSVPRAANIRQISALGNSDLLFEKIVALLDVTFVRNGQLTVIPFPFKYLREYIDSFHFKTS